MIGLQSSKSISPMNSHLSAITCSDTLRMIFEKLPVPDLARASCVCRVWNAVASDADVVRNAFIGQWKLKELIGKPVLRTFWRDNSSIDKFAISHKMVTDDTVPLLAVKYSVQVMDIKRLNNTKSDYAYSRERLLIPISDPELLINAVCYIELDIHAKREVPVLYLEGVPDRRLICLPSKATLDCGQGRILAYWNGGIHIDDGTKQYYVTW